MLKVKQCGKDVCQQLTEKVHIAIKEIAGKTIDKRLFVLVRYFVFFLVRKYINSVLSNNKIIIIEGEG